MVESGDVTVGDSDNVGVVKRREIDALLAGPQGKIEKEKSLETVIANGATYMEIADEALEIVEAKCVD